jgi:ribosomal protein L7/L12
MKLVKKILGGLLLSFGSVVLLAIAVASVAEENVKERNSLIGAALFVGLPPAVLGGWLFRSSQLQHQREQRDRLRSAFFNLLKQGNGLITALGFSMETGLEGSEAKAYLDERAKEFSANFEVSETGDLSYRFDLGMTKLPASSAPAILESGSPAAVSGAAFAGTTFDVILETLPAHRKIEAIKIVRELTHLGLKEAKDLVEAIPTPVKERVSDATAQEYKRKLEAIGATVMLIAN